MSALNILLATKLINGSIMAKRRGRRSTYAEKKGIGEINPASLAVMTYVSDVSTEQAAQALIKSKAETPEQIESHNKFAPVTAAKNKINDIKKSLTSGLTGIKGIIRKVLLVGIFTSIVLFFAYFILKRLGNQVAAKVVK